MDMVGLGLVRERGLEPLRRSLASRSQTCCVCQFRHSRTLLRVGREVFAEISFPARSFSINNLFLDVRFRLQNLRYSAEECRNALRLPPRKFGHLHTDLHVEVNSPLRSLSKASEDAWFSLRLGRRNVGRF